MIKYNSSNLVVGSIKELLKNYNLPKCEILKEGNIVFKDRFYLYKLGIYKLNYVVNNKLADYKVVTSEDLTNINNSNSNFKRIKIYKENEEINNITKNLIISTNIYDTYTHKYLGDYLRFLRDYKNLDLMSMYNCYANESCDYLDVNVSTGVNDDTELFTTKDNNYKIYIVPVKFNQKYTIAIDCNVGISMFAGLYTNKGLVNVTNVTTLYNKTYARVRNPQFRKPFVYDKLSSLYNIINGNPMDTTLGRLLESNECNLCLFIKVPSTNNSSLVVLEGDYTRNTLLHFNERREIVPLMDIASYDDYYKNGNAILPRHYTSQLQLLYINDSSMYPFSDRLIEYLMNNAITPLDKIMEDTVRVQEKLLQGELRGDGQYYPWVEHFSNQLGIWDDILRNTLYDIYQKDNENSIYGNQFDALGYVDKNVEKIIGE